MTEREPLVSVVVAAYDRPELLRESLLSVLRQTWTNLEVLVRDDSPHDRCAQVVAELDDPRLHYTRNDPALGTVTNHVTGYRAAAGSYLTTLNDDDLYSPTYLRTMVEALELHPEATLAFANHSIVDDRGVEDYSMTREVTSRFGRSALTPGLISDALAPALVGRAIPGMFAVVRRDAVDLDDFPTEVSSGYDFWLVYLAVRDGRPIWFDGRLLTAYRAHAGSQTSTFSSDTTQRRRSEDYTQYMDRRLLGDPRIAAVHPEIRRRLARSLVTSGATSLEQRDRRAAARYFATSFKTRPSLRAAAGLVACGTGERGRAAVIRR